MNWPNITTCLVCIIVASMRISGIKTEAFQALAHIVVGILIGECLVQGNSRRKLCLILVVILSIIEVICFLVGLGKS